MIDTVQQPSSGLTYAALDIGSNSFHLLIARINQQRLEILDRHKEMVRLASGLQKDETLSAASIQSALQSLERFAERLRSTPVEQIRVVGTNTLRTAKNSDEFMRQAEKILGTPIHIISGIEEARLIYRGVAADSAPHGKRLVIDIGGGSTELILGLQTPIALESLYIGCVSFSQRFFPNGKLNKKQFKTAVKAARIEAQGHVEVFGRRNWSEAVGSSGTIRAIKTILESLGIADNHCITLDGLKILSAIIFEHDTVSSLALPGLTEDRKPVIAGGVALLYGLFYELGIEQMHVSGYAVREGVLLDLIDRDQHKDLRAVTVKQMMARYQVDKSQVKRVQKAAEHFLGQNQDYFGSQFRRVSRRLNSAISLHEIGLAIAHSGFHKHGAYLLENSDMPGFSKLEQMHLSFLVLNQRRKLKPLPETYGFQPNWDMVLIIRLACLLSRRRDDNNLPEEAMLSFNPDGAIFSFRKRWAKKHPLTLDLLENEKKYMEQQNCILELSY